MPKVTIFGLAGTGTSTVGKMLAERLKYKFVSSGDFYRQKAKNMGLTLLEFNELTSKDSKYDKELDQEIKKFGETNNNFVIESRLAWFFIPDSIKIKLDCNFDVRAERLAARDSISLKAAEEHITSRENFDAVRYKNYYGIASLDADEHFDFVLDTADIPPEQVTENILDYLKI